MTVTLDFTVSDSEPVKCDELRTSDRMMTISELVTNLHSYAAHTRVYPEVSGLAA